MAPLNPQNHIIIISLTLFLFISFPSKTLSQLPSFTPSPTVTNCAPRLLPCAPFVQGMAQLPSQSCCDNLKLLDLEQHDCLCVFLNTTNMSSLPINGTLALQLPALCSIPVNISDCSGVLQNPPSSPASQFASGERKRKRSPSNSTVPASPMFQMEGPIPSFGSSPAVKSKKEQPLVFLMTLTTATFSILTYMVGL